MLVVDRSGGQGVPTSRVARLANGRLRLTEASGRNIKEDVQDAGRRGEPVYFVDNIRLATAFVARFPRSKFVLDIGDDVASLWATQGKDRSRVLGAFLLQRLVERTARGVVSRGLGQSGALRALGVANVVTIPDLPTVEPLPEPPFPGSRQHIGFIGSSHRSRKARPAGWEVPRLLEELPGAFRATVIANGDGLETIAATARERGVFSRLRLIPGCPPATLAAMFKEVGVAISSQTFNLAGEVRTTGKLPDYLAMGKVVVASRVGTAGTILPTSCTVVSSQIYSDDYIHKMARVIERIATIGLDEWFSLSDYSRSLALRLFSIEELGELWREALEAWDMI